MFKSHPIPVFPFSGLVSTFPVILPRQIAVTPPNLGYLASGPIRVMWLHLRPPKQCGFKSHQVPAFSGVGITKYTFFRPNIDHMRFCYGLILVMWLNLRPPKQCGFKSHQVPNFSGVGIRKYTFFRPNIDHMRFCYGLIRVMWLHLRPPEQCGFKSHHMPNFSGVGIKNTLFSGQN